MKRRLVYLISLPVLIAALLSTVLVYALVVRTENRKVEAEALEHAKASATHLQNILNSQLASGRLEGARLSLSVAAMDSGVRTLLLVDAQDRVRLSSRYIMEGDSAARYPAYDQEIASRVRQGGAPALEFTAQRDRLLGYFPVTLRIAENELGRRELGVLFFEHDIAGRLQRERYEAMLYSATFGLLLLLSATLVSLLLRWLVSARIEKLVEVTQKFAEGRSSVRANMSGQDEIAHLAQAFDSMAAQREKAEMAMRIKDAAIASSINAIAFAGIDGKITYVNQAFVDLWRLQGPEDAIGRSPAEFWERPEEAFSVMEEMRLRGSWQGEMPARLGDGTLAEIQLQANMVADENGQPLCMMGSFVDVSARKFAEQELQRSETLLSSLIENMPAMVFVKRASDLRFERLNRAGEGILGYSAQELLGKNDFDFFPSEQAEFFTANDRAVLASHKLKDISEEPILTRNGETIYLHTRKIGIYNEAGEPTHLLGVSIDITEQKRVEADLQQSKDQYDRLTANIPIGVYLLHTTSRFEFNFLYVSSRFCSMLGMKAEDLYADSSLVFKIVHPDDVEQFVALNRIAVAKHETFIWEGRMLINGEARWFRIESRPETLAVGDCIWDGIVVDITDRKHIEAALQHERDYATGLVNTAPMVVLQLDTQGMIEYLNPYFEELTGYSLAEVKGREWFATFLPERDQERIRNLFQSALGEQLIRGNINPIVTRSGHEIEIEWNSQAMRDAQGKVTSLLAVGMDVTERRLAQLELQRNRDLLNEAQRLGHLGSWELDLVSGELRWSDEIFRIFELDPQQFSPSYENFLNAIHPDDREKVNQAYTQSLQNRQPYSIVHRLQMKDGRIKWVREQCSSDFAEDGKPLRSVGAVQDITDHKLAEEQLRVAAVTFEMHEAIMITDARARIIRVNQAFQDITGYNAEDVLGKNPSILNSGRQDAAFYAEFWRSLMQHGTWSGEIWDKRKNGQVYPKWLNVTAVRNEVGEISEYVAIFSDITARKQAEEEIRNLAFYDSLTRLPNRRMLLDRFRLALAASARSNLYGAVMFLDLDRFKTLNDTLGHDFGDLLLIEVSRRILTCLRETDTVARLGGDEFVMLIEEIGEDAEEVSQKAAQIAEKIRVALDEPYEIKGHECHSSPSIGVSLYRGNLQSVDDLLKHADMAMYQAKDAGRNAVRFFDPMMQQAVENRAALEADLRSAVSRHQLHLYYQIQIDNDHRPLGAEALIRWQHPLRGMVSPAQFIPIAEESSLILEIGNWVLETACRQLAAWGRQPQLRHLSIAVNVSAQQFMKLDFVERVDSLLRLNQVDPSRLKLELTESMVLSDIEDVVKKMHALKALGVRLSMDDFGTGYSSLSYLKQLPLDQIKIDQSFVRDITSDPNDAVLVKTIIDMAENFRLNVIAEGVETEAQLAFLRQNGCMAYQGYLFSKPVPIDQLEELLAKHVQ